MTVWSKGFNAAACSGVHSVAAFADRAVAERSADARSVFLSFIKMILRLAQTMYWYCC